MTGSFSRLATAWDRFWFAPQPTSTLALVRIAVGLVTCCWMLSLAPSVLALYGPDGVMATLPEGPPGSWSLFDLGTSRFIVLAAWGLGALAAIALTLGHRSRLAAIVLFVVIMSFDRRNPLTGNAGDGLLRLACLYLALCPSGTALSLDRWRRHRDRFWEFPARAPWGLRLMQIQLSVVYLSTLWSKAGGDRWRDGTAVSYALRIGDIHRYPTPAFVVDSPSLANLMTFGTVLLELAIPILVWNRTARPWVLALGAILHLGIDFSIMVGFFSFTVLCFYLTFLRPESATARILAVRDAVRRRRLVRRDRSRSTADAPSSEAEELVEANESQRSEADLGDFSDPQEDQHNASPTPVESAAVDPHQRKTPPRGGRSPTRSTVSASSGPTESVGRP